jgi:VWFA-related protein
VQHTSAPLPAVRRTYLICIDTLHSAFSNFDRVRGALLRVLGHEQIADSQYALMTLGRQIRVIQDSTQNLPAIMAAIRDRKFLKGIQDSEASSTAVSIQQFTAMMLNYCASCACTSNNGSEAPECLAYKAQIQAFLLSFGERTYMLNQNFLHQMTGLVSATASMPTTRTIIFISDGFNRFPGRELNGILEGYGPKDRRFVFNPRDTEPELQSVLKLATRYDVKFYTIDSRGLYSAAFLDGNALDASSSSSTHTQMDARNIPTERTAATATVVRNAAVIARESADVLAQLAQETGGLFFENSNDLAKGIDRAFADGRQYYVLAYVSKNPALDGNYRKITVELSNSKKLSVTAKSGYWAREN